MSAVIRNAAKADSAHMCKAMRQAGIGKDEPVALIGPRWYRCRRCLRIGRRIYHRACGDSRIAGGQSSDSATHVGHQRGVDDELVAALDGAANPVTDNWSPYKGMYRPRPRQHHPQAFGPAHPATPTGLTPYDAAPWLVRPTAGELSHWIKYHQAARTPPTSASRRARQEAYLVNQAPRNPYARLHDPVRDHCPYDNEPPSSARSAVKSNTTLDRVVKKGAHNGMTSRRWLIKLMKQAQTQECRLKVPVRGGDNIQLDGLMIPHPVITKSTTTSRTLFAKKQKPNSGKAGISSETYQVIVRPGENTGFLRLAVSFHAGKNNSRLKVWHATLSPS